MSDSNKKRWGLCEGFERIDLHDHVCLLYETPDEQFTQVVPFIRLGLERGERCIYFADDNTPLTVLRALRTAGVDIYSAITSGALGVMTKQDASPMQGYFDTNRMIRFLGEAVESAKAAGFSGLRVTCEMTWVLERSLGSG